MGALEDAQAEIEQARDEISKTEVRTELESIAASLQEMRDAEADEKTEGDVAFGGEEFTGTDASADHLQELESHLLKLAKEIDQEPAQDHLESAQGILATHRTGPQNDE